MKTLLLAALLVSAPVLAKGSKSSTRSTTVNGYAKRDGTYVAPHRRTKPNKTETDNYSAKGNANPNTGKEGTKEATK